jgi:photosystem II stability/assembly factor-like uncharacterized protein
MKPHDPRIAVTVLLLFLFCLVPLAAAAGDDMSRPAVLAPQSLLLGVAAAGDAVIAVGERGHVLRSTDEGHNWQQIIVPTRATLTAVTFADALHGWAVGHDQTILKTVDGGLSWQLVYRDTDEAPPLLDLYFLDAERGFAVGAYGSFFSTGDGGQNWEKHWISEDDFHLNQIRAVNGTIFIAAEAGLVYRSDDQGETFSALMPDYEGSFFGLLPLNDSRLLLFGLRGHLFRSADLGATWELLDTGTEAGLTCGLRLRDGTLIVAGLSGALLVSRDDGRSFLSRQEADRKGFSQLLETMSGEILAVGDFGVTLLPRALFR